MKYLTFLFSFIFASSSLVSSANGVKGNFSPDTLEYAPSDWFNLDYKKDKFLGISTNRAYNELLAGKKSNKVVIAILDSGVDFDHQDLKGSIWTNKNEVPGNGIDDDNNGYTDDVHGWNFIAKNAALKVTNESPSIAGVPDDKNKTKASTSKAAVAGPVATTDETRTMMKERFYGDNSIAGSGSNHGTHVSGIIAASRNNGLGVSGIADNIEIMVLRVVPDGHEKDIDVANAVFYAVDNGAKIINMSFGKSYSPNKDYVDAAFRYAESHDVLIVHAAGNYSENNDMIAFYPCRTYRTGEECSTWLEVGALTWKKGPYMVADFSNYGKNNVDLFAPGVDINSTVTGQKYRYLNGTSMAAPMVTGVAALVWSYYPELSALDVKTIVLQSSVRFDKEMVFVPGDYSKKVPFSELSRTGGVVNAYTALKMAEKISSH